MMPEANEEILTQIDTFKTVFDCIGLYDSSMNNIRIYGILDDNDHCREPLFHGGDVIKCIAGHNTHKFRIFKRFQPDIEIKKRIVIINNIARECNLLTIRGMISALRVCRGGVVSIAFREIIYALFNKLNESSELQNEIFSDVHREMNSPETLNRIKLIEENKSKGFVYFIQNTVTKNIKIGRTDDDVEARLMSLQTGNDCELILLKTIECNSRVVEKQLHEKFSQYHVRGEWFNINMEQIESALN